MMKMTFSKILKRGLLTVSCMSAMTVVAQTARQFTLSNSSDGGSTLTCYLPESPTGRAVVDCPGGGYVGLAMEHEGHDWAGYFNAKGIAYFVLKYRMPHGNRDIPLGDAYRAMKTVRDSASSWRINPYDVGIMGFSAGGHLAATVSTHAPFESRPDFSILFYPVISMSKSVSHRGSVENFLGDGSNDENLVRAYSADRAVRRHLTPPAVLFTSNDDDAVPPVTNAVAYYSAMRQAGNNCVLHVYSTGGHGWGFNPFAHHDQILADLNLWLDELQGPKQNALRVACIGNSITDGSGIDMSERNGYPARLQKILGRGYHVKNFGVSARTMLHQGDFPYMKELAWRDVLAFKPDIVIVKLGTNDSKPHNWQHGGEFQHDMQQMVDTLKSLASQPEIYLATPIPAYAHNFGICDSTIVADVIPAILNVARKNKCKIIDFHSLFQNGERQMQGDGIHPTREGAAQMARIVADEIMTKK